MVFREEDEITLAWKAGGREYTAKSFVVEYDPERLVISGWRGFEKDVGNINAGSTGTFAATLLQNGAPLTTPPVPATVWTYSCSDSSVTIAPSADTTSAVYSVPSNDTGTSFQAAASAVAPDGTTVTTPPLTVTLTPGTTSTVFSASIAQTA